MVQHYIKTQAAIYSEIKVIGQQETTELHTIKYPIGINIKVNWLNAINDREIINTQDGDVT